MSIIPADALPLRAISETIAIPRARFRIQAIDALRGLVIMLMTLDHVRDYFTNAPFDPLDLTQTGGALFMTRWITHLCAPTFIFLAGISAYLMSRQSDLRSVRRFLITRGLWLIFLEFTVVHFAWMFNFRYENGVFMQVIWAIGASMIVLAALVGTPRWFIGLFAFTLIFGHNLLDGIDPAMLGSWGWLWSLIHAPTQTSHAFILYPLVPWVAVMALGYYAGVIFEMEEERRLKVLLGAGVLCTALFIALRLVNVYGDPHPWMMQSTTLLNVLAFINVHKYPPSLMYLLITIGTASMLLAALEMMRDGKLVRVLQVYGRVPLFVYVLHIVTAHLAAGLVALALGFGPALLNNFFLAKPEGWGFGLLGVYVAWIAVLIVLYPACRWFADVKRRRKDWWLAYL